MPIGLTCEDGKSSNALRRGPARRDRRAALEIQTPSR